MQSMALEPQDTTAGSLELVELELALKHQDLVELGFEGAILRALAQVNGRLLFKMRLDGVDGCNWVAAVVLEDQSQPGFALITQKTETGIVEVESITSSVLPVARIVSAYAGLMSTLHRLQ